MYVSVNLIMLQLFSSGLFSMWLDMAGVQTKPLDTWELLALQSRPGLVVASDPNPVGTTLVQQYLKELEDLGHLKANQGIWMQSSPLLLANNSGTVPLPAASLTKIATSLAAVKTWGTNRQFETKVSAIGLIKNGVLHGDLVITGGGDPLFVWEETIALGNSLNRLGINQVTGNLVITGNFAMNYQTNRLQAGQMLKQGLNSALWSKAVTAKYWKFPKGTPRPRVAIAGSVSVATVPSPKQILLLRHYSLPLWQILKQMNVYSNNEMAEMLASQLGGAQVVKRLAVTTTRVPPAEIMLVNGSGLGVENRISPRAACAMLMALQRELIPYQMSLADLFPVSGRDRIGTLETRHIPANAVVKTGTLHNVSALAGVIPTRDRALVWFTIINRGSNIERLRTKQDQLLQRLLQKWGASPTLPAVLTPHHSLGKLGASERNQIIYKRVGGE